jgi:hypothetical protein
LNEHLDIENELANIVKLESKESVQHGFDEIQFSARKKINGIIPLDGAGKNGTQVHPFE